MTNYKKVSFLVIALNAMMLAFSGCVTTKNTFMHRQWHNLNSRYNGYFYARENINETFKTIEVANVDDYTQLIPMFIYPSEEALATYGASFDKTIEKSSTVIQRHAITHPKTKEEIANACKWIDENYMLIGQSHFYKKEYIAAQEIFTYVSQKYEEPESKYPGMVWLIRTNNELGSLSLSEPIIDEIRNAEDFPEKKKYQRELTAAIADYYIKREDYPEAIKHLEEAISITKNKQTKARYTFILAQLYERVGDRKKASMIFAEVPGLHPPYEMVFAAKMNWARLYDADQGDNKAIKKELLKMLKDSKNTEYQDQIYYALAQIVYKENDEALALSYLEKSVQNSISNDNQKAMSFLQIGDILHVKTDYARAEANYDSSVTYLSADHPEYEQANIKKNSLKELVVNLRIIRHHDSLLVLAKMPEKKREKAIETIRKNIEIALQKKAAAQLQLASQQVSTKRKPTKTNNLALNPSAWYFYNASTVAFGTGEFAKKWGIRELEDNWRRSEKESDAFADVAIDDVAAIDPATKVLDLDQTTPKTVGSPTYLSSIPKTSKEIALANKKIADAYYQVGIIYNEQLKNPSKSIGAFRTLLQKHPKSQHRLSTLYQLHRIYLSIDNQKMAEYFKEMILRTYPSSEYGMIIKDPDYAKKATANKNYIEEMYSETFEYYVNSDYEKALANCNKAALRYSSNHLMPKFNLMKAYIIGETKDVKTLKNALAHVVKRHPNTPEQAKAQALIDMIASRNLLAVDTTKITDTTEVISIYTDREDGDYYWMIISKKDKVNLATLATKIATLNGKLFGAAKLKVKTRSLIDSTLQMIVLEEFDGKIDAMAYYNLVEGNKVDFEGKEAGEHQRFVISKDNYDLFYKEQNLDDYKRFFTLNFN